jgi:asparagine synthase (glutamine-hydrolysing)
MSGIAGVWNVDGRPVDAGVLAAMSGALRHRGPDGERRRIAGPFGLAHQHLLTLPEEAREAQPLEDASGVLLAFDGRVDNRRELLAALNLPGSTSDAAVVLAAYDAWRDRFASHLNGDFALAVFDPRVPRLLLARDCIGIRPLYYTRHDGFVAFASEVKALLEHPDVEVRADDEGIADFVLTPSRPIDRQEVTCFSGVSSVVPAHTVSIEPGRLASRRYWDFDPGRTIGLRSPEEYCDAYRERFVEAVRRRARSSRPVAVSVSGGLDSSSIFCQAETLRRAGVAECPGVAGISHLGVEGSEADERAYLAAVERDYRVSIEAFPIEPLGEYARDLREQVINNEAPLFDYMWAATREVHGRATRRGARVLLSGAWGDQVLFSSAYLVDLFGRLAWSRVRRHLREYTAWFGAAESRALARRLPIDFARHHLPRQIVRPCKWIRRRLFGADRARPWYSERFLERALRFANQPALIGSGFHSAHARGIYSEARSKYHVHCMEWQNKAAARSGLDVAFPFLDRDLLAFLMAIPGEVQTPGGVPRGLARQAMRGVLPEAIRTRRSKADFSGFVNRGVARDAATIAGMLDGGSLGIRLGYFNPEQLVPAVIALARGIDRDDCRDAWDLSDAFGLEVWLQVFLGGRTPAPPRGHIINQGDADDRKEEPPSHQEAAVPRAQVEGAR